MSDAHSSLLIILRGPSGSGKSRTATALRERYGRGLAIVRLSEHASVVNVPDLLLYVASMYVTQPSFPHGGGGYGKQVFVGFI